MSMIPAGFLQVYARAMHNGTETTLEDLIGALQLQGMSSTLDQVQLVEETLKQCELEIQPNLIVGGLKTARVLRPLRQPGISREIIISEISEGETPSQEFKSSLLYDHKRAVAAPSTPPSQLRSDDVTHSCLKTVAAFLTSSGGILYVGVSDDGDCIGIEPDFQFLRQSHGNKDGWELHLRDLITGRFKDGASVNDYVRVDFAKVQGRIIARLQVHARKKLSFVKKGDSSFLYRRQGNRTMEVKYEEIEEFMAFRQEGR